jgi:hypothetical protein
MQGMKALFHVWEPVCVLGLLLAVTAAIVGSKSFEGNPKI